MTKKLQGIQRNRKVWLIQKKNKATETVPEKVLTEDLLDKGFKTTILQMLKKLKEDMNKPRKWCINKMKISIEKENLKKKPKFWKWKVQ